LVFRAILAIRPRLCSVHIQNLNDNPAAFGSPTRPILKKQALTEVEHGKIFAFPERTGVNPWTTRVQEKQHRLTDWLGNGSPSSGAGGNLFGLPLVSGVAQSGNWEMRTIGVACQRSGLRFTLAISLACLGYSAALAQAVQAEQHEKQGEDTTDLAKAAQNPIANLISLPFQNNLNFNVGPHSQPQNVLNIQPVVPITLDTDWNLITRWITPVVSQPPLSITGDREFGLGDVNPSFFFSPVKPTNGIIWGIGPTFVFPTGTDKTLTQGKYSIGPTFVALTVQGPWVAGVLVNNVWSFAGKSNRENVDQMTMQPFVNYNFHGGRYRQRKLAGERQGALDGTDRRRLRARVQDRRPAGQRTAGRLLQRRETNGCRQLAVARAQVQFLFPR
jgi:hypothetical protein